MVKKRLEKRVSGAPPGAMVKAVRGGPLREGFDSWLLAWQFNEMELEGPWAFVNLNPAVWGNILTKLKDYETRTWAEVKGDRDHSINVVSICPEARRRLREIEKDDYEEVFSIHLDGEKRIIGLRDRNVFKVLWWDPNHSVCPSRLRHT